MMGVGEREERRREHAEIEAGLRGQLKEAGDFSGVDYSGFSDDLIGRAARCAQVIKQDGLSGSEMAATIACYMHGAVAKAIEGAQ